MKKPVKVNAQALKDIKKMNDKKNKAVQSGNVIHK